MVIHSSVYDQSFFYVDVDECDLSPCFNNGTCINTNGSYACNCTAGWKSKDCDEGKHIVKSLFQDNFVHSIQNA